MSSTRKNYGLSFAWFALGLLALLGGTRSLLLVIPAAVVLGYAAAARLRRARN